MGRGGSFQDDGDPIHWGTWKGGTKEKKRMENTHAGRPPESGEERTGAASTERSMKEDCAGRGLRGEGYIVTNDSAKGRGWKSC